MSRYIDADAFRKELVNRQIVTQFFNPRERHEIGCIIEMLDNTPAADVVEVVRCKDCAFFEENKNGNIVSIKCHNTYGMLITAENEYCSRGKRRETDGHY